MKLKDFWSFFRDRIVGRKHNFPIFCTVGQEILIFEVKKGDGGVLKIGRGLDGLILILGMYIEDVDMLVKEQQRY